MGQHVQAELARFQAGLFGALAANAVLRLTVVTQQLIGGGRIRATTESALPVHEASSRHASRRSRGFEPGYEKVANLNLHGWRFGVDGAGIFSV